MTEPWPYALPKGINAERAEGMWPRDLRFRPDKVKLARQARGLTLKEAAQLADITPYRLRRLERNLTTPIEVEKQRIAKAWGFPLPFFAQDDPVIDFRLQIRAHLRGGP